MRDLSGMIAHRRFMAERDKDKIVQQYSEPYFQGLIAAYTDIVNFAIDLDAEKNKMNYEAINKKGGVMGTLTKEDLNNMTLPELRELLEMIEEEIERKEDIEVNE